MTMKLDLQIWSGPALTFGPFRLDPQEGALLHAGRAPRLRSLGERAGEVLKAEHKS
jgi:hypothetical protein